MFLRDVSTRGLFSEDESVVASWFASRVQPFWGYEPGDAVFHVAFPFAEVDDFVVVETQTHQIVEDGFPAQGPVLDVMRFCVFHASVAGGEGAAFVALVEYASQFRWRGPLIRGDVEDL